MSARHRTRPSSGPGAVPHRPPPPPPFSPRPAHFPRRCSVAPRTGGFPPQAKLRFCHKPSFTGFGPALQAAPALPPAAPRPPDRPVAGALASNRPPAATAGGYRPAGPGGPGPEMQQDARLVRPRGPGRGLPRRAQPGGAGGSAEGGGGDRGGAGNGGPGGVTAGLGPGPGSGLPGLAISTTKYCARDCCKYCTCDCCRGLSSSGWRASKEPRSPLGGPRTRVGGGRAETLTTEARPC